MATRDRGYTAWCGDLQKILLALHVYRPELQLYVFGSFAGPYRKGLTVIPGLHPSCTVLLDNYERIDGDILGDKYDVASIA